MDAVILCPRCQRSLRLPEACAGAAVRCPLCARTFETKGAGFGMTVVRERTRSTQPDSDLPIPPGDQKHHAAHTSNSLGGSKLVQRGLISIMAAQVLDLGVLGLNCLVLLLGLSEQDPDLLDDLWQELGGPMACLAMFFILLSGLCALLGLLCCQSATAPKMVAGFELPLKLLAVVYLLRLVLCPVVEPNATGGFAEIEATSFWRTWIFWAGLLPRWMIEGLLLLYLYHFTRDWRHSPTLVRVKWAVAFLVSEMLLQLAVFAGVFDSWRLFFVRHFALGDIEVGALLCAPMLIVRLVVFVQMINVLLAAWCAFADHADWLKRRTKEPSGASSRGCAAEVAPCVPRPCRPCWW